ncbi:hypothetical protein D9V37_04185 [Nocardioides mangrovicus]|uniref:Uncharacterized protein n=1 Tax=Nocardioides mangrovicus TaxID=2478913 RepID=A0A3L8P7J9_9ACTN|nr:hypothetical protein [Nocardioides mangrovicus]RLV51124.1 hypothetical protein D9V37_04185 [Nocardioides mangrovicus]
MRTTLLLMGPLNLVLVIWVWIGRVVFGVGGWFILILMPVALLLLVGLVATTILAWTQDGRPRSLTRGQSVAQIITWVGMLGFGAFLPDFGDTDDSYTSLLSQLFGRSDSLNSVSFTIAVAFGVAAVIGYLVLLVLLIARRRTAPLLAS